MTGGHAVGILSAAHVHADPYASVLSRKKDVDFVGIADDNPQYGKGLAKKHDTSFLAQDELIDRLDCAVVCSTNEEHHEWIEPAARAGVDVLCEKPLGRTTDEADRIIETCRSHGVMLGVAMPLRFSLPAKEAKSAFESGAIGSLHSLSGTNRGKMPGGWFTDPDSAGGGAVMDHTVHIVDLVHWLTGERVREVYAETATRFYEIGVEDVNLLSMELTDGTQFLLDGSWSKPEEWDFWGDATLELAGSEGRIAVDCFDQTFKRTRDVGEDVGIETVFWGDDPNEGLLDDFVRASIHDREPETTGEQGRDAVAVVEAAYESSRRGRPVAVEY